MIQRVLFTLTFCFLCFSGVLYAQKKASTKQRKDGTKQRREHFSRQLLHLEAELEQLQVRLDDEERRVRKAINDKIEEIYALKQKQRNIGEDTPKQDIVDLSKKIENLSKGVEKDRTRLIETMAAVEKKRKEIFSLKMNIDEWVIKVEATEVAVIDRIEQMKTAILNTIAKMEEDFMSDGKDTSKTSNNGSPKK